MKSFEDDQQFWEDDQQCFEFNFQSYWKPVKLIGECMRHIGRFTILFQIKLQE